MNRVFEIEYMGDGTKRVPAYSCGHCSATVILNPDRVRDRLTCKKCGRWLCEQNELCRIDCTPIYELAADHTWQDGSQWSRLVPAIMGGVHTVEAAVKKGLLKE